ncbi:triose-phosphate isomerase [Marinimicrobium alkaliphilum]|uniref:triose-phosphate isomerase n=1 Tax=Marinimicrobium alkaliphilum TaxID=2202654 RepID=UPI001E4D175F|nr:triose-phosphate isomerase [Marinimicrobium alkaliphilum]
MDAQKPGPQRRPLVVANWKLNGSRRSNQALLEALVAGWKAQSGSAEVAICPPFIYLPQAAELLEKSEFYLGGQNLSQYSEGAYTGEVSGKMLAETGCRYVIIGHSERRQLFNETDELVAEKFAAALSHGLTPILCVGESLEECDGGHTLAVVGRQLGVVIDKVGLEAFARAVVAYEPVWAIGTGRHATPADAQRVHAYIRERLGVQGETIQVLYGGSVKPDNAPELFAMADIDGGLIGGASLKSEDFLAICRAAG